MPSTFEHSPTPRYLIDDSKLYSKDNATQLKPLGFITWVPDTLKLVSQVISQSLTEETWQAVDNTTRDHRGEGGFRFLKDPLFFCLVALCQETISDSGLLMVMTLALWVYSVAPRRLRRALARQKESLPNPTNQPTQRPTLR